MKNKLLILLFTLIFLVNINLFSAECSAGQININTASLEELDELYGIGPAKSQAIIDARPYNSIDDLTNAYGIGEVTLNNIKSQGLGCVKGDENSQENNELTENIVNEISESEETKNLEIIDEIKIAPLIILNAKPEESKNIKTKENSEFDKKKYATYGFISFCVFLALLFVLRRSKIKNEIV